MPFEPNKNAKELGIDITRKFRVVVDEPFFSKGDIITLQRDDNSVCPFFSKVDGSNYSPTYWFSLEYADEEQKFRIGEKVRRIKSAYCEMKIGDIGTVMDVSKYFLKINEFRGLHDPDNFELVNEPVKNNNLINSDTANNNGVTTKSMSIKEKFVQAFLSEPEKSFRKAGITDNNGMLTPDGEQVFVAWLLKMNGDAFKQAVVDDLLKEPEEK